MISDYDDRKKMFKPLVKNIKFNGFSFDHFLFFNFNHVASGEIFSAKHFLEIKSYLVMAFAYF